MSTCATDFYSKSKLVTKPPFIPKIIFFDIDDTLSRAGVLDANNQTILSKLAKTDIKLVIATGRSKSIIPPDIMALYDADIIDAIICTNGQYSFDQQGVISHYPLTKTQANNIHAICDYSNLIHKFDSAEHIAWSDVNERIISFNEKTPSAIVDPNYYKHHTVYQCSVFFNHETDKLEAVDFAAQGLKLVIWHHMGGDILPIDASKARAVRDVCQYYNVDVKDTWAFGDGFNDIEMFELVGFAVAMGDAQPDLVKRADAVTGTIEERGIEHMVTPLF